MTATSATDSVASSSSANADRNATRSVRSVARRYSAASARIRPRWARPAERDEHVEAGDEVEEVVPEHGQRAPLAAGGPLGVQPDEDHEDRDEGHGEADDEPGEPVGDQDPQRDRGGHDGRHQQGRQVAAEVALQPVEPHGWRQRGELARGRHPGMAWAQPQDVRDERGAQLAHGAASADARWAATSPAHTSAARQATTAAMAVSAAARSRSPAPPRKASLSTPAERSWAWIITRPAVATATPAAAMMNRRAAEACRSSRGSSGFIGSGPPRPWSRSGAVPCGPGCQPG